MKRSLKLSLWLACASAIPTAILVQAQTPTQAPAASPATRAPQPDPADGLTGRPPGVARLPNHNSVGFSLTTTEGQPIETRPPEKADDKPAFAGQTRAPFQASAPVSVATITDKLLSPWSLAFLPDGKFLITEKAGTIRIVDAAGTLSAPLTGVPAVSAVGQVGLLDLALDNGFAGNKRLFFTYAEPVGDHSAIVIARATLDEAAGALRDVTVIFRSGPAMVARLATNAGGRLAIASDGTIFATIGDRSGSPPWDMAQRLDNTLGKIIHITADGKPARNNPFLNTPGARPEIWTLGHRSEEGLAFDNNGQLWENENGPRGGDKLIKVERGKNYGWPVYVHGIDYPGETIGDGITEKPGLEQPRYYWDPVIAPSGMAFTKGNLFPQWKNSVFIGSLRGEFLDRLTLDGNKVVAEEPLLVDQKARIRDVRVGPDGAVMSSPTMANC